MKHWVIKVQMYMYLYHGSKTGLETVPTSNTHLITEIRDFKYIHTPIGIGC